MKRVSYKAQRKYKLKYKYSMIGKDYAKIAQKQNNRCAICHRLEINNKRYLSIDHDHVTGKVRGLLCHNCNVMLGMAGDNIKILINAAEYLKNNQ